MYKAGLKIYELLDMCRLPELQYNIIIFYIHMQMALPAEAKDTAEWLNRSTSHIVKKYFLQLLLILLIPPASFADNPFTYIHEVAFEMM
jgi:hypothetical protein